MTFIPNFSNFGKGVNKMMNFNNKIRPFVFEKS